MNIGDLIVKLKDGKIAKATFGGKHWYITWSEGFIRYYDDGEIGGIVPLTYSNIHAEYELITK